MMYTSIIISSYLPTYNLSTYQVPIRYVFSFITRSFTIPHAARPLFSPHHGRTTTHIAPLASIWVGFFFLLVVNSSRFSNVVANRGCWRSRNPQKPIHKFSTSTTQGPAPQSPSFALDRFVYESPRDGNVFARLQVQTTSSSKSNSTA